MLLTRLRDRGWRLSAQRRTVAEVFVGDNVHLTADEVLDLAQERLPIEGIAEEIERRVNAPWKTPKS